MHIIDQGRCLAHMVSCQRMESPRCGKARGERGMRWTPLCFPFRNTTLSRPDSTACSTCWDEMRTRRCSAGWAELQALCGWKPCTPGASQSITPYSIAYPLPTHVTFSGNKQLFYGLPPTEAKWRCCHNPMRDIWCYFKSVFISTFKLIGKGFFSVHIVRDWQGRNYMAHSRSFS